MKILEKKIVTEEVEYCTDIICNKCGESLKGGCDYEGLMEARISFGYDSRLFGDMSEIEFSVCEKCLYEFTKTFKHDPKVRGGWWEDTVEFNEIIEGADGK